MTALVVINTRSGDMRRYEGRKRTHKVVIPDAAAHPLSAAYLPVIKEFIKNPGKFFISDSQPQGVA